jgi:hypothetical protein
VQIFEDEDHGPLSGTVLNDFRHPLEQTKVVLGTEDRLSAPDTPFGEQPGKFRPPPRIEPVDQFQIMNQTAAAHGVDPWAEWQNALALAATADQYLAPVAVRGTQGLVD